MALDGCISASRGWIDGKLVDVEITPEEIKRDVAHHELVWIDLLRPTKEDIRELGELIGLAPTTIEDISASNERPKVTRHEKNIYFTVYTATLDDAGQLITHRISGVQMEWALITIRMDDAFDMAPVVARWEDNSDLIRYGPGALTHGLLDYVVDGHFATIQSMDDQIEELEDQLFDQQRTGQAFARQVYDFRKSLVTLRRVVLPMREVVNALVRRRQEGNELDHWYDDLYDHVLRAAEWTESLRDMVTTMFETNLSLQDSRLNIVMKKLASWAAIIAVPTAITGWFGQNVPYPGFAKPLGLWLSVIFIVICSGALYAAFKRRDWL